MAKVKMESIYKAPAVAIRKHETAAIVAVMEDEKLDTAEKMARKVLSTAFQMLNERDWFVVGSRLDEHSPITLYGSFATESAAMKALDKNTLGLFGQASIYELKGITTRADSIDALDDALILDCRECGHSEVAHKWPRTRVKGCVIRPCKCGAYVRPERKIERVSAV